MNRAADYRTTEDKLFDMYNHPSASEGEKFNAGAMYFKRTGKLIEMHQRTPDPNARPKPSYGGFSVEDIMRQWAADEEKRRARRQAEEAAWGAPAPRPRRRTTTSRNRTGTYRSRWASSSNARDYSSKGWTRSGIGWVDADGRYHSADGRYAKRPRP